MLLALRASSYRCTWEVWRALKKLELLSAAPRATLTLLLCSPNFPDHSSGLTDPYYATLATRLFLSTQNFIFVARDLAGTQISDGGANVTQLLQTSYG